MSLRLLLASTIFLLVEGYSSAQLPVPFQVIPEPKQVQLAGGKGFTPENLRGIRMPAHISLLVPGTTLSALPENSRANVVLCIDSTPGRFTHREGYMLRIGKNHIQLAAATEAGLFYGCQTLEQLLEDAIRFHTAIPAMTITDQPAMQYRAVHFDVKHHLDQQSYYYNAIDRLARYKINAVVFEFEDKLRYRRQPLAAAPHAISIEEMAALTRYARQRNIEITPLVQGLGHASYFLKHEANQLLREIPWNDWAFCPLYEPTYQVLFDLYRDAIEATPGSLYLHVGGDEIGNIGVCERCRPFVQQFGLAKLNAYWLQRVCAFAATQHRIPIFWDDMPLQQAGLYETTWNENITRKQADSTWKKNSPLLDSLLPSFPLNGVFMRWNYSMATQPGNLLCLDWYQQKKLPVMLATAVNAEGGPLFQPDIRNQGLASAGNSCIKSFLELGAHRNIDGMLCTAWDDRSPHLENFWPGFITAAEYSWSPQRKTLEALDQAWASKEFGSALPQWPALQQRLRFGSELWYTALFEQGSWFDDDNQLQSLKQVEHWLKPVPGREKTVFDYSSKLISVPDRQHPGEWSEKYAAKLWKARQAVNEYPSLINGLRQLEKQSVRNKYYWRIQAALCRFQVATPALLLALQQADQKPGDNPAHLTQATVEIQNAFDALCTVYRETRFTEQPPGFVPDRYFHMASQREDMSWMMQAQELYLEKIKQQMNCKFP